MAIHVTPHKKGWQVKTGGASKAYRVKPTQEEAIAVAKSVAKNQKTDVKIHRKNGQVRDGINYNKK